MFAFLQEMIEEEGNLELQKKRQDEANERKNAVEAYVYSLRNHLSDKLAQFVTESEQASVSEKLNQTEVRCPWLTATCKGFDPASCHNNMSLLELMCCCPGRAGCA